MADAGPDAVAGVTAPSAWRRPVASVVAVLVACGLLLGASVASSRAATTPVVKPGASIVLHASGFKARVQVQFALKNVRGRTNLRADSHGRVSVRVRVPSRTGSYTYLFVGAPPAYGHTSIAPVRGRGDHQIEQVRVPRLVTVPIIVRTPPKGGGKGTGGKGTGGQGTGGQGTGKGHSPGGQGAGGQGAHSGGSGHGGSGTANTGFDVLAGLAAGLVALVSGAAFVLLGRRRRHRVA